MLARTFPSNFQVFPFPVRPSLQTFANRPFGDNAALGLVRGTEQ